MGYISGVLGDLSKFGVSNDIGFWSKYSGLSVGSDTDHMVKVLGDAGFTGSPGDMFRSWCDTLGTLPFHRDNLRSFMSMPALDSLTFYKRFNRSNLNAEISVGSPTATFTASRDATHPATYIDSSGVLQLTTTSNVGRFTHGFYDSSGFNLFSQSGVMIEGASTNFLTDSMFGRAIGADEWESNWGIITDSDAEIINISGAKERNVTYTFDGTEGDFQRTLRQLTATDSFDASGGNIDITASFWAKGDISGITTGTGVTTFVRVIATNNAGNFQQEIVGITLNNISLSTTEWRRFTFSGTITNVNVRKVEITFIALTGSNKPTNGENFDITITAAQLEKSTFATSFIPTTTAALTRNTESLKYVISGNRTAAVESIVFKLAPSFPSTATGKSRRISETDTKIRRTILRDNDFRVFSNATDSDPSKVEDIINESWTANQEMTLGYNVQHSSPFVAGFFDGVADGTNETVNDFVNPAWGTFFHIGSDNGGNNQLNGTIFSIGFWDRVLSASEQLAAHNQE